MNDHVAWELIKKTRDEMQGLFATAMAAVHAITGEAVAIYPTVAAARAVTVGASFVCILSDYNSSNGIFIKDATYTVVLQGADGFTDLGGVNYKRFQNE